MSSACTGVTSNAFVSANRDVGPGSACSSQSTATPPPATPISYEGRVSLLAPNHAAHFGGVPRRAIKVECDMLDLNGHGVHHAANLDAALPLYQSFSPPFAALGNSSAILTPPATHADAAERKSTPPLNWTPTTPTRISTVDSLAAGGVRGHSINDSGISPGHAVSDCPTDGSDGKSAKRDSVSSGDDLGHQMAPSASPSFSNDDEDDDMTNEMDEEDDDDDVDEEEDDEQDAVGDALSRLQRALEAGRTQNGQTDVYQCHLCSYSGTSRFHFQAHLNTHFDVKCTHCDFTARTEGKLRAHMRNAHGVQTDAGKEGRATRVNPSGKAKSFKCKQCQFVAVSKMSYWEHSRSHIKAEKLLTCPKCPFVTEYKHHLEYHMRNHFGSKPFKCPKCSYSCVNKSMLNSHMKSHSNVYQYRCADCAYATKYCHSLKLHLRKYGHTPTVELHDTEEGPAADRKRSRKRQSKTRTSDKSKPVKDPMPKATTPLKETPGVTTNSTVGYGLPLARMAGHHPPTDGSDVKKPRVEDVERRKCDLCDFTCADKNELSRHLVVHAAAENRDLANLFGVESNAPACSSSPLGHKMATDMPQVKDYLRMLANPLLFGAGFPGAAPLLASRNPVRDLDCADSDSNRTMTPEATPKRPSAAPLDLSRDKDDPSALPSTGQSNKHRRKGQAFKLERPPARQSPPLSSHSLTPSPPPVPEEKSGDQSATFSGAYQCNYCDIAFKDVVMYTMHMGYHGYQDPFTCNMCGQQTNDKLSFFLHIARSSHV